MNEVALSDNLTTLTTEIKTYQNVAGSAIFEIGRRLIHVKEHDLAHGEFGTFLKTVGMERREAQRFMKVARELPNTTTLAHLSNQALYLIASIPEEERDRPQELSNGDVKKPKDMTVRELQETKKKLKQREKEISNLFAENEALKNQEPERVEIPVEVEPADYKKTKQDKDFLYKANKRQKEQIDELEQKLQQYQEGSEQFKKIQQQITEAQSKKQSIIRQAAAVGNIYDWKGKLDEVIDQASPMLYKADIEELDADDPAFKTIKHAYDHLATLTSELGQVLNAVEGGMIING
ncbi:DUF3102 domain-containing protein [Lacticaseibacillus hulanensis]|uniref:DUF3102 domain-containing protein n=1 Tax=Lacticaseibacillus hulanensis TaxID=2493111 RepID=UPI000FDBAB3E|nr:DUF3102 domain-containing protein [Lacticaseibacillus hulanensis]